MFPHLRQSNPEESLLRPTENHLRGLHVEGVADPSVTHRHSRLDQLRDADARENLGILQSHGARYCPGS